ncbi:hypothetical protein [Mucilaginibacter sp. SJ]|uniref:hypothetical protein n=1 Tax=Mucilaginibacter sp. SJ TaxID=3029053 RepID=UPI0023A988B5|nr:hypothetical protein [Mucilaginibacter sp. SJ]WEA00794.1 hypothetical protein MusilaSJ_25405 [Mucilaginibacter sp. SJ]
MNWFKFKLLYVKLIDFINLFTENTLPLATLNYNFYTVDFTWVNRQTPDQHRQADVIS